MYKLKKGNPEKLEGKVFAYVHNLDSSQNGPKYPAIFASTSPLDLLSYQGITPTSENQGLWKMAQEQIKSLNEKKDSCSLSPILGVFDILDSLNDIPTIKADVLFGNEVLNIDSVLPNLTGLITAYMTNYMTQLEKKSNSATSQVQINFKDSFKNYDGEGLESNLYKLSGELLDSLYQKDGKREKETIAKIKLFAEGASFYPSMLNLIGMAQTMHPKKLDIISSYISLAKAIHNQDFEKAALVKKKLDDWLK